MNFKKSRSELLLKSFTFIKQGLPKAMKTKLMSLLRENLDLFARAPKYMPGIDPKDIYHKLVIDPKLRPMAQKRRKLGLEK